MSDNLQKKPSKGILKTSRSMEQEASVTSSKRLKEQRFDEKNVEETFHPANKEYGHMKIDEPKTPFSESADGVLQPTEELDANILAAKLAASMNKKPKCRNVECKREEDDEEHPDETAEERLRRLEFEKKRKGHYNEYQALQLARKLMEQEEDEDEEEDKNNKKT